MIEAIDFKVKRLTDTAILPTKAFEHDAGIDIYSDEEIILEPLKPVLVSTGISVSFPPGYVALLWDRSGLGSKGVHRFCGVIDSSYRGEWKVCLCLISPSLRPALSEYKKIEKGDRIIQCVFQKVEPVRILEVEDLDGTARGSGGFGSTGS